MKKLQMKLKKAADALAGLMRVRNTLNEQGQALLDAVNAAIQSVLDSEVEYDEEALRQTILEVVNKSGEVPEAVAEAIAAKVKALQNSIGGDHKQELPMKVRNAICGAILTAGTKENVRDAVNAVLVKNEITGLTFADVVDYTIVEKWGDYNPLFAALRRTFYTKFFYNEDDLKTASILAKQWGGLTEQQAEKLIQDVQAEGKQISTKYIYKRQRVAQEDLDEIQKAGESANFLRWLNEELDRQIANTIVMAILVGDTVNPAGSRVTTFETIGNKSDSDMFTTVVAPEDDSVPPTLVDVAKMCNEVYNPNGKEKWLIINPTALFEISKFVYGDGGTTDLRGEEEIKTKLGVDKIFKSDLLDSSYSSGNPVAICMLPDGYWYVEKNAIDVSYPQYEKNVLNFQKERNCGGAIHDLKSTSVLVSL